MHPSNAVPFLSWTLGNAQLEKKIHALSIWMPSVPDTQRSEWGYSAAMIYLIGRKSSQVSSKINFYLDLASKPTPLADMVNLEKLVPGGPRDHFPVGLRDPAPPVC